ncbi:MAG TPA: RNA polymerase sigma factor [Gemmatimonadales bacterium]|nr:RNA polymerase sigma factor [Gemmatimonadales bacterium]
MSASDAELVGRVRGGDLTAYAELVTRHRQRLERLAYHLLGDAADAEDALQDALMRAYRSISQCRHPERFQAWLLSILMNRCRTRLARRDAVVRDSPARDALERAGGPDLSEAGLWREEIDRALSRLAPDQREAFLLKHVEELSYEEIAALTGASISALKMRVNRACERLRDLLKDVYHG